MSNANTIVSTVYRYVIDDVINQARGEFEEMGIDDSVLQQLQRSWETKVARSRVATFGFQEYEEGAVDTEGINSYMNPYSHGQDSQDQAGSLASIASGSSGIRPPLKPDLQPYALPNMAPKPPVPGANGQYHPVLPTGQPSSPSTGPGARLNIPQNDGPNDGYTTAQIDAHIADIASGRHGDDKDDFELSFSATSSSGAALSLDSLPESVQLLIRDARERAAATKAPMTRIAQLDGESNEDDINSDLDDSDDADEDAEGGEEIEHIILCLYDKVTRTKNKWKCILKDGIMLVNGRDYLFHRANGDFEW